MLKYLLICNNIFLIVKDLSIFYHLSIYKLLILSIQVIVIMQFKMKNNIDLVNEKKSLISKKKEGVGISSKKNWSWQQLIWTHLFLSYME